MAISEPVSGHDEADDFKARASEVFRQQLYTPMFQNAPRRPDDVLDLISEIRAQLETLEAAIGLSALGASDQAAAAGSAKTNSVADAVGDVVPINGAMVSCSPTTDACGDVGRNQRSKLRELAILEFMAGGSGACALKQILSELTQRGFADSTAGAVVSQLHRLKNTGVVDQPHNGMYKITDGGILHMHDLRGNLGGLRG